MRVFLTGATGYIGSAIAQQLLHAGHKVVGLVQNDEEAVRLLPDITPHIGDLFNRESLETEIANADAVIHAGSPNNKRSAEADTNVVSVIEKLYSDSGKTFIYTSGAWLVGSTNGMIADESTPLNPTPLIAWRVPIEASVLQLSARNIRTIAIRPALVYGRNGGVPRMFTQSAQQYNIVRYVGNGDNRWSVVWVDDLAKLYVLAL